MAHEFRFHEKINLYELFLDIPINIGILKLINEILYWWYDDN